MSLKIVIDGTPVAKARPRIATVKGKTRAYTPKKTRDYEARIAKAASDVMGDKPVLTCPVVCWIRVHVPVPKSYSKKHREDIQAGDLYPAKKPDLDNYIKAALDGINGIILHDDNQVCVISAAKYYAEIPRLEISVAAL